MLMLQIGIFPTSTQELFSSPVNPYNCCMLSFFVMYFSIGKQCLINTFNASKLPFRPVFHERVSVPVSARVSCHFHVCVSADDFSLGSPLAHAIPVENDITRIRVFQSGICMALRSSSHLCARDVTEGLFNQTNDTPTPN